MALLYDPAAAQAHLAAADDTLSGLIQRVGPCRIEARSFNNPFQALLRVIVYQQLSGKAAATIFGRVEALFDGPPTPEQLLALPPEALRGAGMSRAKVAAANDLAARTLDGTVPGLADLQALPDDAVVERLTAVRGLGPWSVQMMLMFQLGRPDVLPVTDLGVRKGFMLTYGLPELPPPRHLLAHGERWRPYRSVASWYLWRAVDLAAG